MNLPNLEAHVSNASQARLEVKDDKISVQADNNPQPAATASLSPAEPASRPAPEKPAISPRQENLTRFIQNYNKRLSNAQAQIIAEAILRFSDRYNVDYRVVTSVIAVESTFRSDAVSSSGAIGLGQLKPATARWLGVMNPYDPIDNVAGATRYLSWLMKKYNGSWDHALSAYYQGPGTVDRQGITQRCVPYLLKVNKVLSLF